VSLFHRHHWKTTGERYSPRPEGMTNVRGTNEFLLKATYGVTVITQECDSCGEARVLTTAGRTEAA
jgi:hypothetical protein